MSFWVALLFIFTVLCFLFFSLFYGVSLSGFFVSFFGFVWVLLVPAYLLSYLFFPSSRDMGVAEKVGFSLGLSVALLLLVSVLEERLLGRVVTRDLLYRDMGVVMVVMMVFRGFDHFFRTRFVRHKRETLKVSEMPVKPETGKSDEN